MDDNKKDQRDEAIARAKEKVAQEVKDHKDEDSDLHDVVGGTAENSDALWSISYTT